METLYIVPHTRQEVDQGTEQHKQEIDPKGQPNELTGSAIDLHLGDHIVDDVADRKYQQRPSEIDGAKTELFQCEKVRRYQAGGKHRCQDDEQSAYRQGLELHYLVLLTRAIKHAYDEIRLHK